MFDYDIKQKTIDAQKILIADVKGMQNNFL
jgi:hypothetical protein